jgi:Pyruvate/2-oxoacid:ferredoxin oxidoreductase delta subunit
MKMTKNKRNKMVKVAAWKTILTIFRVFFKSASYFRYPLIGPLLKKIADLEPEAHTQGYTLNINADVTDAAQGVVLPIDMMKQIVKESNYWAIMNNCICRTAYECKEFPHNHGCIFIGEGARGIVKNRIGRKATLEEAISHIDKGAELGLIGQALWIEVERFLVGVKKDKDVARWLEICFCCPCCCGTFKLMKNSNLKEIKERFHSIGWKAEVNFDNCVECMQCIDKCPVQAISQEENHIIIDKDKCLGCGFCAARCSVDAIKLKLQTPLLNNVKDYFTQTGLKVELYHFEYLNGIQ